MNGKTVATLFGKWDESMHYVDGTSAKGKRSDQSEAHLLWKRNKPSKFPTRYNFTRFAMTLNEMTPGLRVRVYSCHVPSDYLYKINLWTVKRFYCRVELYIPKVHCERLQNNFFIDLLELLDILEILKVLLHAELCFY